MAERNIEKAIKEGRKNTSADGYRYSLTCNETAKVIIASKAPITDMTINLVYNAYCVGVLSGYRKGKREAQKGAKV